MPPKAPESKAAKAAKALAGGKKKAKVRSSEKRNRCDRASRGDPNEDASGRCRYGRCARRTRGGREEDARANDQNGFVRARAFGRWRRGMDANASREGTSRRIPALGCASVDELGD